MTGRFDSRMRNHIGRSWSFLNRCWREKPAGFAACGFREFGAGISADRQLRGMRPVLLKTISLRNRIGRIVAQLHVGYMTYANIVAAPTGQRPSMVSRNAGRAGMGNSWVLPPVVGVFLRTGTRRPIPRAWPSQWPAQHKPATTRPI